MLSIDYKRRLKNSIKIILKKALNRGYYPRIECRCKTVYLGSDYGGWEVAGDFLDNSSIVYSFGIGEDISFDLGLMDLYGVKVHAFDPTPRSIAWVGSQKLKPNFIFHSFGVADFDGSASFLPPNNLSFVSFRMATKIDKRDNEYIFPVKKLSSVINELGHDRIDLLKMDVEGAEYEIIEDMRKSGIRPRQVLVEFHHRWPEIGVKRTRETMQTLSDIGYKLFYTSARDEFGFLLML
jgi:FkbM family methyltransferase